MSSPQLTQPTSQHNLLTLPREVRDQIYLAVLQTPSPPPPSPKDAGPRSAGYCLELPHHGCNFYPPAADPHYASETLLLCNHQTNAEIRELLARHETRGLDFRLDVMTQGYNFWPTWTLLPGPVTHIRNLEVDVRIFDVHLGNFEPLLHLFGGFFHHGPQLFCSKGDPVDRRVRVDTISQAIYCNELPITDAMNAETPPSLLSMDRWMVQSVLLGLRTVTGEGGMGWRVSNLDLRTHEEVLSFPAGDENISQEMMDYWDAYGKDWVVKKTTSGR